MQKALVYFSDYKLRKISDKISGRRPNQNIDGNTYFNLIIFKRIFDEKSGKGLIKTFKSSSLSFSGTLILI